MRGRRIARDPTISIRRVSAITSQTLAGGIVNGTVPITLGGFVTSDLQSVFQEYRVKKVVVQLTPREDPGNSGIVNNAQKHVICASDTDNVASTNTQGVGAYANAKSGVLVAGKSFYYTWYPKVCNYVFNGTTGAAAATYKTNPWLLLNATGVTIPHYMLLYAIQSTNATDTSVVDFQYTIYFDVRGFT